MGRWQPDARGRLCEAGLDLYAERGYEQVTVADIADRAGLTARTFFRYFADKRDVLFSGSDVLAEKLAGALADAPPEDPPLAAVAGALAVVADVIGQDHRHSSQRQTIIVANTDLQERERSKMAAWAAALGAGLRARGVAEPAASLAAETGVAVFRVAFEAWVAGSGERALVDALRDSFDELRTVAGAG